jgi:glutathione S-transferase
MLTDFGHALQMTMLKIYGWRKSRTVRCMWAMEELGLSYEQLPLNPNAGETRTPEYLALNPSGKIPTLVHDGFVLTETVAINLYLASTFPGTLLPSGAHNVAKLHQWTSWALADLEPALVSIMREGRRPKEQQDASRVETAHADIHKMLATVLEPHLAHQPYLLPDADFTLADLNVASVASSMQVFNVSLVDHPAVDAWMKRCFARPAWQRAQARP